MSVLHINIRLTEGGAGRVAWDLHRRLQRSGRESQFLYGYASGIGEDANAVGDGIIRVGEKARVIANYAVHRLVGEVPFVPGKQAFIDAIDAASVVHLHAIHHYFTNPHWLLSMLAKKRKPTVMTLHDWWLLTGRCAFIGTCPGWRQSCGICSLSVDKDHLPSLFDFSAPRLRAKRALIRDLAPHLILAAPSKHILEDHRAALPDLDIRYVPNSYDLEFENLLSTPPSPRVRDPMHPKVLVMAADLSYAPKTSPDVVRAVIQATGAHLVTVGRHSPFDGPFVENLGYVGDRTRLTTILGQVDYLLYTSAVDNAPLTLIESLVVGTPVLSLASPAADEMLARVGGRTASTAQELIDMLINGGADRLYDGGTRREILSARAQTVFSPAAWLEQYTDIYADAVQL